MPPELEFHTLGGKQAGQHLDEYSALYREVYAEPPYEWGNAHAELFRERFEVQRQQDGFTLVEARAGTDLVGLSFGVTLGPATPWWQDLLTPLPAEVTREYPGRTFALVELLVRAQWRRQHVASTIHQLLLADRPEERATLTVLPAATAAHAGYRQWGWQSIAQKRNPLPGSPVFDVMVRTLKE